MKLSRRFYSLIPLVLVLYMLYTVDEWSLLLLPLAMMGVQWHFFGMLFLAGTGILLVYRNVGGLYGIVIMILALISVEMGQMDRERAPHEHYAVLVLSAFLSIPTYMLIRGLAPVLPRIEVTAVAVGIVLALYLFTKLVGEG